MMHMSHKLAAAGGGGPVSGDSNLAIGTQVTWTPGTFFDSWTSQSGVTTTDIASRDTNNLQWQLFYAHVGVKITTGTQRALVNPRQNGTNIVSGRGAVASANNTIGGFTGEAQFATHAVTSYTAGTPFYLTQNTQFDVPANRYFLLGIVGGPFYKVHKTLAANRTAVYSGNAIVTAIPRFWWPGWPSGPTTGIPTQVGGAQPGFTEYTGYIPVTSFKFELA